MALATRPKPKAHQRKRQAGHHRLTKHYTKAYWPYLPMLGIVGMGVWLNRNWQVGYTPGGSPQTRIEALAGLDNTWALSAVVIIAGAAFAMLVFRHWFRIQRTLNRGEAFVAQHPWFDLILALLATGGIVLTRAVH